MTHVYESYHQVNFWYKDPLSISTHGHTWAPRNHINACPPAISTSHQKFLLKLKSHFNYFLVNIDNLSFVQSAQVAQDLNLPSQNAQLAFASIYYYAFLSLFSLGYCCPFCRPGADIGLLRRPHPPHPSPCVKSSSSRPISSTGTESIYRTMRRLAG